MLSAHFAALSNFCKHSLFFSSQQLKEQKVAGNRTNEVRASVAVVLPEEHCLGKRKRVICDKSHHLCDWRKEKNISKKQELYLYSIFACPLLVESMDYAFTYS